MSFGREFVRLWSKTEAIPVIVPTALGAGFAAYYIAYMAHGHDVQWNRWGDMEAFQKVDRNAQTKFMAVNQKYTTKYNRWSSAWEQWKQ
ncbi:hypothetical protein M427DRAFT_132382 [Gonapodya prolifera JEL478]|uniref:NADH-ubiquinone reductase complex 1 MLRQ subunit n=1 Tax=Gonapodya prolifera (strain JEL478) TaxID=1344416 RepID=A0A139AQC3_GONPJ|nr:hypothetical protein M427DRAFT_132382 [Gonapodya prolifera JEL478]|eukprot:KXS18854.1 hypothetical protein M427DRAFT_132382 [Gonapodya prolifera JEL478]